MAVDEGEIDVEQHEVNRLPADHHQRLRAVFGHQDLIAGRLQQGVGQLAIQDVVLDDQHRVVLILSLPPFRAALGPQFDDLVVEGPRFRIGVDAQFAFEHFGTRFKLLQGIHQIAALHVQAHQRAMDGLLKDVDAQRVLRRGDGLVDGAAAGLHL